MTKDLDFFIGASRRGEILARRELNGSITGILPGGYIGEDKLDNQELLWRIASWKTEADAFDVFPPTHTRTISVKDAIEYQPDFKEWILERSAEQLSIITGFLARGAIKGVALDIQRLRTAYVLQEVKEAVEYYETLEGELATTPKEIIEAREALASSS